MYELKTDIDARGVESLAGMAELGRYGYGYGRHHGRRGRRNVCLITANHSLNGVSILNVLNSFGGW